MKIILYKIYERRSGDPLKCFKQLMIAELIILPLLLLLMNIYSSLVDLVGFVGWGLENMRGNFKYTVIAPFIIVGFVSDFIIITISKGGANAKKAISLIVWVNLFGMLVLALLPLMTTPTEWALMYNDVEMCGENTDPNEEYKCMYSSRYGEFVSDETPPIELCASITENQRPCYYRNYLANHSPRICEGIPERASPEIKKECYEYMATKLVNASLCERLTGDKAKRICYAGVYREPIFSACKSDKDCVLVGSESCNNCVKSINRKYLDEWGKIHPAEPGTSDLNITNIKKWMYHEYHAYCELNICKRSWETKCTEGHTFYRAECMPTEKAEYLRKLAYGEINITSNKTASPVTKKPMNYSKIHDTEYQWLKERCEYKLFETTCQCMYSGIIRRKKIKSKIRKSHYCEILARIPCGTKDEPYTKDNCILELAIYESECQKISDPFLAERCMNKI
ncbi:hypothetical protein ACFLRF_05905 [Candidatus Altiarchaeota archaeon]